MKRRLTRAYDHMTMPEGCAHRIEQQMLTRLQEKKTGCYAKTISPVKSRRSGWVAAAAAVCAVVLLSVGGSALFLSLPWQTLDGPKEPVASFATAETTRPATAEDHYALVTELPAREVEAFAAEVRQNVLDGDWEAFAEKVHYPIAVYDKNVGNDGGLVGLTIRNPVKESFVLQIEKESCAAMFCNWQGICMADGRLWINEVDGELKITAINDMFGDLVDPADFQYSETETGKAALHGYSGMAEEVTIPSRYNQNVLNQIGTGTKVIWNGKFVRNIHIPESVTVVREGAFADCPALEAVFFRGDAPAEMDGVFDGSPNVTVYYQEGTKGWGDTWCGRPTLPYSSTYITLGTVTLAPSRQDQAMILYQNILEGAADFYADEFGQFMTISQYCEKKQQEAGMAVSVSRFTLADLDDDGIKELVLWVCIDEKFEFDYGSLVLRYQDSGTARGWFLQYGQMFDLKKDGSFLWNAGLGGGSGAAKLILGEDDWSYLAMDAAQQMDKVAVRWHVYPCQKPYLVLSTYETISTGQWGDTLGWQFYYLEELAKGNLEPDWNLLEPKLVMDELRYTVDAGGDLVYVFDPASPGCWMSLSLADAGQITMLEYYVCNGGGEFHVNISGLQSKLEYEIVDSVSFDQRRLKNLEEVWDFFGQEQVYEEGIRDMVQIRALADTFCNAYFAGNMEFLREHVAKSSSIRVEAYPGGGEATIVSYKGLPEPIDLGDSCSVSIELLEPGQDSYSYLNLDLLREEGSWKVRSYSLEK